MGSKRQQEINDIVTQLAKYNPEHIFVEATERWAPTYQLAYQQHQQGKLPKEKWIAKNEIFQLGIKTAARINLAKGVTPVDWQQPFTNDTTKAFKDPVQEAYRQYWKSVQSVSFPIEEAQTEKYKQVFKQNIELMNNIPNLSLKEALLKMNSPETRKFFYYINVLFFMDKNPKGVGVEVSHTQNYRNMKIYQNILKNIMDKTERCLVIYVAGHIQALRSMFESNPRFEVVEVSTILK